MSAESADSASESDLRALQSAERIPLAGVGDNFEAGALDLTYCGEGFDEL
jgi:hypothetical protein